MKKYHYKVDVCKVYLKYLYAIDEKKTYKNKKLIFLQNLKKELIKENLLEYNPSFKEYLKTKKKVVFNYPKLDLYEKKALEIEESKPIEEKELTVTEYKTMEEEINGVALKIISLSNFDNCAKSFGLCKFTGIKYTIPGNSISLSGNK